LDSATDRAAPQSPPLKGAPYGYQEEETGKLITVARRLETRTYEELASVLVIASSISVMRRMECTFRIFYVGFATS
jgi:hypothetical protein